MSDHGRSRVRIRRLGNRISFPMILLLLALVLFSACQPSTADLTPDATPTAGSTPTPSPTATLPSAQSLFLTYAHGEIMPDMRVPIQRNASGEGGWYTVIGTQEGWAQFLSQMGQPAQIWEPVSWGQDIVIGALLGIRGGRGHEITIRDVEIAGITVEITVETSDPASEPDPTWVAYPFHLIRVPRQEIALGPVTFEFLTPEGQVLVSKEIDMTDLSIVWLPGESANYPTPTPPPSTSTPEPTSTATPVPNQQTTGTILEVMPETLQLRLLPDRGEWQYIELMEASSILSADGQSTTFSQLQPGMTISVLGYTGADGRTRAAHVDILGLPAEEVAFARYQPRDVGLATLYDGYVLPLPVETLSATVPVTQVFGLSQTHALTQAGFVVVPSAYPSFAALYQDPKAGDLPVFVSADAALHVTERVLGNTFYALERDHLLPELTMLDRLMFEASWAQVQDASDDATPESQLLARTAQRNAAYFGVALSLLDPEFSVPTEISGVVEAELALISAGEAITVSPLLDLPGLSDGDKQKTDYSRFVPPAQYAQDTGLDAYYRALTWHRAIAFRPWQREETRSAALIAYTMDTNPAARLLWERLQTVLGAFQGQDASLSAADYAEVLSGIVAEDATILALSDPETLDAFEQAIPSVSLPDNTIWELMRKTGLPARTWRFLSPPFRLDDYVFARTTDAPGENGENGRTLPSLLDLSLALGSIESYRIASEQGTSQGTNYLDRTGQVRNDLMALQLTDWTQDLHSGWLYACRTMVADKTPSYPQWMRTASWRRRELQALFAGWTSLHHSIEASPVLTEPVPLEETELLGERWGYVEPQPETYARLAALVSMVIDGLDQRLMLPSGSRVELVELEAWLSFLQDAARRELTGQALSGEEYQRLAEVVPLLQLATRGDLNVSLALSIGADETNRQVEAVGYVDTLYVLIERDRQLYLARGGVYSHYEFPWPLEQSLSDDVWQDMLVQGEVPERPAWVEGFTIE